jgi:hypothetical protein
MLGNAANSEEHRESLLLVRGCVQLVGLTIS